MIRHCDKASNTNHKRANTDSALVFYDILRQISENSRSRFGVAAQIRIVGIATGCRKPWAIENTNVNHC